MLYVKVTVNTMPAFYIMELSQVFNFLCYNVAF